jgi:hypothetical protein
MGLPQGFSMRLFADKLGPAALLAVCILHAAVLPTRAQTAAHISARGGASVAVEVKPLAGSLFANLATPTPTPTPAQEPTPTTAAPAAAAAPVRQDAGAATTTAARAGEAAAAAASGNGGGRLIPTSRGPIALPAEKAAPVKIPRFESAPVIDGKLDEEVWKQATVLKDFYQIQPGDNIAPSKQTEVLLGYDAKYLYVAFRALDEPDKVRATVAKRDAVFDDDYVGMILDTFNDKRKGFEFNFNPLGVQADAVFSNENEDFSVDVVHESKGAINQEGYVVEIAIPFKSLRYEAGAGKLWGAHFFRRIKRFNNEQSSWMPISREITGTLIQAGQLTGLEGI